MNIDHWTQSQGRFLPNKTAIIFQGRHEHASSGPNTLTFSELEQRVLITCYLLRHHWQIDKGERIAWLGLNHPDMFVLLLAAARLGIIVVPMNWRLSVDELGFIARDCTPKALFYDQLKAKEAEALSAALPILAIVPLGNETAPGSLGQLITNAEDIEQSIFDQTVVAADPCLIVYTSGTTGRPKGAVLSHRAMICNALMSRHMYDLSDQDTVLNVLPLFHVGGINIQPLPALMFGATLVLHQQFHPQSCMQAICDHPITLINCVPTILQAMQATTLWHDGDLSSLKSVSIGSTDVPRTLIEAVHARGIPLVQVYGATETGPIAIYQRPERAMATAGSIGQAGLLCHVQLCDDQGKEVANGQSGEICIKGNNLFDGYWQNDEATNQAFRGQWFRTGDIAHKDHSGDYWFDDRVKHVIISGGENIYPAEIERVINALPQVSAVSVVGQPDEKWGEVSVAVIELAAGASITKQQVLDTCETKLARFKRPRQVIFVDALPRNAMGKVIVAEVKNQIDALG